MVRVLRRRFRAGGMLSGKCRAFDEQSLFAWSWCGVADVVSLGVFM